MMVFIFPYLQKDVKKQKVSEKPPIGHREACKEGPGALRHSIAIDRPGDRTETLVCEIGVILVVGHRKIDGIDHC